MAERLATLPDLQVVQVLSAGVDWVERHVPDGVTLCNAGDTRSPAVAQWVVAAILADLIGFQRAEAARLERSWEHWQPRELAGKRVVIVGHGSIGRAVERRLAPFGVRIGRVARSARPGVEPVERLAEAVAGADVVVVLAPLSESTRGLVGTEEIARMQEGALLVNAGRGPVVDTDALVAAVRDGPDPRRARRHGPRAAAGGPRAVDARRRLHHAAQLRRHPGGRAGRAGAGARADAALPRGPAAAARGQRARTPSAMNVTSASSSAFVIRFAKFSGMMLSPPPPTSALGATIDSRM